MLCAREDTTLHSVVVLHRAILITAQCTTAGRRFMGSLDYEAEIDGFYVAEFLMELR